MNSMLVGDNVNKLVAVLMVLALLITTIVFGLARIPLPGEVSTLFGAIVGFVVHALGVTSGASNATTAAASTAATTAAAVEAAHVNGLINNGGTSRPSSSPTPQI